MRPEGTYYLTKPVFFIGFMGAGKTSLARRLARNLGLVSIDTDTYMAHQLGITAGEFIREYGETAFRTQEAQVLEEMLERPPAFISCGGGVVETPENLELLSRGFVVYLRVSADQAKDRISNLASRPLFGDIQRARELVAHRGPLYEGVADIIVDTAGKSVALLAAEVQPLLASRGALCLQQK